VDITRSTLRCQRFCFPFLAYHYFSFSFFFLAFVSLAETQESSSKNEQQIPVSAYYLQPGENSGMVLVTSQLDGSNYHSWSRAMKRALISKNKFKFLNGDLLEASRSDNQYEAWERCNVMVISLITRSITTQIAQSTMYIDNAKEL